MTKPKPKQAKEDGLNTAQLLLAVETLRAVVADARDYCTRTNWARLTPNEIMTAEHAANVLEKAHADQGNRDIPPNRKRHTS